MKHKRVIYIGNEIAREAVGSKESLEALAVVLSIKLTFVNSIVSKATAVRVMKILRIGFTRYNRAVSYALNAGWLVRKGDKLVAVLKLKTPNSFNIKFCFTRTFYKGERNNDVVAAYTLTELCNYIRQGVLLFHISRQATVYDTVTMATHPTKAQGHKAMRSARRRLKRWGMREPKLNGKANRLSYAKMSEVICCSKSKSKSLVKNLVSNGVITKHENYRRTKINVRDYANHGALIRETHIEAKKRGYLVYHNGAVCVRLANSYTINRSPVKFKFAHAV